MAVVQDFERGGEYTTLCSSQEAHAAFNGSCRECREARFNPGPPSMTKRQRRNRAHDEALREDAERSTTTVAVV